MSRSNISVCIPCGFGHLKYLPGLINNIMQSSIKPADIQFVVSGVSDRKLAESILGEISCSVRCDGVLIEEKRNAAQNRNFLAGRASSPIISYVDADDLVHPKRIEFIEMAFESSNSVHVNTSFEFLNESISDLILKNPCDAPEVIELAKFHHEIFKFGLFGARIFGNYGNFNPAEQRGLNFHVHNGSVSVLKDILKHVKYKENPGSYIIAEDQDLNYEIFARFNRSVILKNPLYFYNLTDRLNGGF